MSLRRAVPPCDTPTAAVWRTAEKDMHSSVTTGTPWNPSLCGRISAFGAFDTWVSDMAVVGTFSKRFKHTVADLQGPSDPRSKNPRQPGGRPPFKPADKSPTPKTYEVGERADSVVHDGDWCRHSAQSTEHFHTANCLALAASLGHEDQCILVGTSRSLTVQSAARYCQRGHAANAPEHSLYHSQDDFFAAVKNATDPTEYIKEIQRKPTHEERDRKFQDAGNGGGKGARGGGRGKGGGRSFRGRAARQ